MAEETKAVVVLREVENIEALEAVPQSKRAVTYIKDTPNERKFAICALIPENDEEAQARYACSVHDLISKGVVQLMYSIKASAIKAELESGADEATISKNLQAMADEKTNESTRQPGKAAETRKKASQLDQLLAMANAKGFDSVEDYIKSLTAGKKGK